MAVSSSVASSNHGFSSLVLDRTRSQPSAAPTPPLQRARTTETYPSELSLRMPSAHEVVVISDDEAPIRDGIRAVQQHIRPRIERSPMLRRDSKRQKLSDGASVHLPQVSSSEIAGPSNTTARAQLNFISSNGFTQTLPSFVTDQEAGMYSHSLATATKNQMTILPTPKVLKELQTPYFDDPKLHIRMFRGPGFEHFPVPVDSDPLHEEYCATFDAKVREKQERRRQKQMRHNQFGPYIDETIEVEDSDNSDSNHDRSSRDMKFTDDEAACLARILEVLPDVQHGFVLEKIRAQHESWNFSGEEIEVLPDTDAVMAEILESGAYPKELHKTEAKDLFEEETGKTIKWHKDHRDHRSYQEDAVAVLASQFDYVPTHYIKKVLVQKRCLWDAYIHVEDKDTNWFRLSEKPYKRATQPRAQLEKKYQRPHLSQNSQYHTSLVLELVAAKQHVARALLKKNEEQQRADVEKVNLEEHKAAGLVVECQCCFEEEVPMNRSVTCTASSQEHYFCYTCVESLANSQIGLMKHEMQCMHGGGCTEALNMDAVGRAIPIKTFDRLLLNEQQAAIASANIEGLEQCPFCDFKAICEPVDVDVIFSCQNPDCFKVTCRKCREASHCPKTCQEAKQERGLGARHRVEEARSEAMIRTCPQCKQKLIKELGCNKIRCTCSAIICYVCKADLFKLRDGYDHFNKGLSKCPLYDTPGGVERHDQDANDAERQAINAVRAEDETIEEVTLQIQTGKTTSAGRPNEANMPVYVHAAPHAHHNARRVQNGREAYLRERMNAQARVAHLESQKYRRLAQVAPMLGPYANIPWQIPDFDFLPRAGNGINVAGTIAAPSIAPAQLGVHRAELQRLQDELARQTVAAGGDRPYVETWQRQQAAGTDHAVAATLQENADERDRLVTANRVHNHIADNNRRRQARGNRRNSAQQNQNTTFNPNPTYFNIRAPQSTRVGAAPPPPHLDGTLLQPVAHDARATAYGPQGVDDYFNNFPLHTNIEDGFGFDAPAQQDNTWREQYRPPTATRANHTGVITSDSQWRPRRRQHLRGASTFAFDLDLPDQNETLDVGQQLFQGPQPHEDASQQWDWFQDNPPQAATGRKPEVRLPDDIFGDSGLDGQDRQFTGF